MKFEQMTKAQLLKEVKRLSPYEWRAADAVNSLEEIGALLMTFRESGNFNFKHQGEQSINGIISLVFRAEWELRELWEK